ncbi:Mitochondrial F1F0-ATP synthase subunit d/ATP7 [Klebsormidium nitens]|uniref:Mitochondrial F1F0-ATP synthase subunit d/ATP7 n=1 Tax=Klebsormidium nitens TaxID=105231 RepID=A0A1Y1IA92_KLENI|nr:Mitochondrial F1F0-ATP synthase subunit d/ATP7 [Klebsormidium nitens]|eukprot:GAQ86872.1 Mitochondrial F1F0-ATP synthase subunit d/ATP7 [Klebsormidium nitens]
MSAKAAAEKAVKTVRGIDWGLLERLVKSDDGRKELLTLRRTIDETRTQLDLFRKRKPVNIDWNYYKAELNPVMIDEFKAAYEDVKIGEYKETLSPKFEQDYKEMVTKAAEAAKEAKVEAAKLEAEAKELEKQKAALKTLTADEYFKSHPQVLEQIDDEIRQGIWGPSKE